MERVFKSNLFVYGEVGERLSGIRESEIYQQSAQKIENLIINEMGNLKIAKKLEATNFQHNLIQLIDTKYNFYVGVTKDNKVATYNKINSDIGNLLYTHPITVKNIRIIKMCDERLFVIGDTTEVFEFNKSDGKIGKSNYLSLLKFPIKDREPVKLDIYKIYKVGANFRVGLIGTVENPLVQGSGNGLYISGANLVVQRLYKTYKAGVSASDIEPSFLVNGNTFAVFRNYTPSVIENISQDGGYVSYTLKKAHIIGNFYIDLDEKDKNSYDSTYGSDYCNANRIGNAKGELNYGTILPITQNIKSVAIYQDRMVIIGNDGYVFFSKKSDYFDFRNDTKVDSAFFFKPTPINNIYPEMYDIYIGDKMFVLTSQGVYVISTNNILTSGMYNVFIASEIACNNKTKYSYKKAATLLNGTFYYLTDTNEIRCVEQVPNSQGVENYTTSNLEKYELVPKFNGVDKLKYNNKNYLIAFKEEKTDTLYLYEQLEYKVFRRFSLKLDKPINNFIFCNKNIFGFIDNVAIKFDETGNNVAKAILRINPPYMKTEKGGSYSNDYSSRVLRVFVKVLNENKEAIKGIKINDKVVTKNDIENDLFNVFKIETSFPILNGFNIEITTKENNKIFEILGIDAKIDVISD
ncbi:hypothetical protein KST83_10705 [Fusobacterium nucleatum]|uniref:Uncharacterized protein n=1 Tax=Fusobacterium nucleatum subsp. polymorphum TaxID=76857 RepID=A0A2C6AXC7_FUSNP|nr:hypothetical protein [Fusobacterium polymorphum]PHH96610.1 hypothetical protein CA840_04250 [Fusobacterium polymorphum]